MILFTGSANSDFVDFIHLLSVLYFFNIGKIILLLLIYYIFYFYICVVMFNYKHL